MFHSPASAQVHKHLLASKSKAQTHIELTMRIDFSSFSTILSYGSIRSQQKADSFCQSGINQAMRNQRQHKPLEKTHMIIITLQQNDININQACSVAIT